MKDTTRFSKNYTISQDSTKNKKDHDTTESQVSIRQCLKSAPDNCIQEILEFIRNTNSCVMSELSE